MICSQNTVGREANTQSKESTQGHLHIIHKLKWQEKYTLTSTQVKNTSALENGMLNTELNIDRQPALHYMANYLHAALEKKLS